MKLNRLETHDRLEYFIKDQSGTIWQGADDCLKRNPDSLKLQDKSHYIYIFAHPRTDDDGVTKRLFWQPRLTKPKAQTNSYLFRAKSKTDILEICWLLPPEDLWAQYQDGKLFEDNWILWSINQFLYNRAELEAPFRDDWDDNQVLNILKSIINENLNIKPKIEEAFSSP